jgi:hypothetical protein
VRRGGPRVRTPPIWIMRLVAPLALAAVLARVNAAQSEHVSGPDGLEAWTLPRTLENGNEASTTLTIARHGKVMRRFRGNHICCNAALRPPRERSPQIR